MGGRLGVMDILSNIDPEIERTDSSRKSVLHYAAMGQNVKMVANLISQLPKSFVNQSDSDGKTPLHHAATNNYFLRVQKSSDPGALNMARDDIFQYEQKSAEICEIFLQNGASVEIRDKNVGLSFPKLIEIECF